MSNPLKKRRQLPLFQKLDYQFDIEKLRAQFFQMQLDDLSKYGDLKPGSKLYEDALHYRKYLHKWFMTSEEISKNVENNEAFYGDDYLQLSLTDFDESHYGRTNFALLEAQQEAPPLSRMKRVQPGSPGYIPEADERNYTKRNSLCTGYFEEVLNTFKSPIARTRFAALKPGFRTDTHIDADTDYTIRIHIPICTNPNAVFGIYGKDGLDERHLPADGSAYFCNTGFPHYVENRGVSARVHLLIAINGQEDLPGQLDLPSDHLSCPTNE